jgi:S-DNA-T family DNA segregation ATPase FtsK/SpoIIIE
LSSDFIENPDISGDSSTKKQLSGVQRILEAGLLFFTVFALFMMLALFSFNPADPGWAQTGYQTDIRNLGGPVGAYLSDLCLNLFGFIAYTLPFLIAIVGWLLFQRFHELLKLDYLTLGLKLIGFFMLYLGLTSLASMNFDDLFYFSAGGILGDALSETLLPYFSFVGSTLVFLLLACSGFVLLTGFSWLTFIDEVGRYTIILSLWLAKLPSFIKSHFGIADTKVNIQPAANNTFETSDTSEVSIEGNTSLNYVDQTSAQKSSVKHESADTLVTTDKADKVTKAKQLKTVALKEKSEPFIDIAELMKDPVVGNIQDHVNEKEITAAFAKVDKPQVDDDISPLTPHVLQADDIILTTGQNITQQHGQVNLEKAEDSFAGMPSIDLLDRPDKAKKSYQPR